MKKLLIILLILISFSSFAQFEAGEFINTDTVKIDGVPLLLNTFKQGNLGGASNIFYSTGASSQPASGSINQVMANNLLNPNTVVKWDGSKFANSSISDNETVITLKNTELRTNVSYSLSLGTWGQYNATINNNSNNVGFAGQANATINNNSNNVGTWGQNSATINNNSDNVGAYGFSFSSTGSNVLTIINGLGLGYNTRPKNTETTDEIIIGANAVGNGDSTVTIGNSLIKSNHFSGKIIANKFESTVLTGTPPLVVASSTKVDNLNVEMLDDKHASDFQLKSDTLTFDATLSDLADSTAAIRALANTKATVSGTDNYIMKKTGTNELGNSNLIDYGSHVSSAARFNAPSFLAGTTYYSDGYAKLGVGRTGNNFAYIDFTGDQTYANYGFRIIRGNTGANATSSIFHRGKGDFSILAQDAGRVILGTKNTSALIIDTLKNVGVGTSTPAARIHSQSTTTQLRLGYNATKYTDLSTGSTGNLTIDPTGDTVKVVGAVNSTGGFFKNGVEIVGGGGISTIGITVPTGLTVSPASISASDTFEIGLLSGRVIPENQDILNGINGYDNQIVSAGFSGTTTKQLDLLQKDGGHIYASFTDLTASDWVTDTYGIKYNAGKVCVGTATSPSFSAELTVGNGSNTTHGIYASSLNQSAVFATSTSGFGVTAQSGYVAISGTGTGGGTGVKGSSANGFGGEFAGLGCKATKFYVSSLNTAPASSSAAGTTGEIRICSTGIYICIATNTWIRQLFSTW